MQPSSQWALATNAMFRGSLRPSVNDRFATDQAFRSLPPSGFSYPNTRQVAYNQDELCRRTDTQQDAGSIASWLFFGRARVAELDSAAAERSLPAGGGLRCNSATHLICTHMNNDRTNSAVQTSVSNPAWGDRSSDRLGFDGAGRMITKRYLDATASASGYSDTERGLGVRPKRLDCRSAHVGRGPVHGQASSMPGHATR